jgi:hypothetical protein
MNVIGLMMVRNEADIVEVNVRHHLAEGVDRFLVVDNGSSDDTPAVLDRLQQEGLLEWRSDPGAYRQADLTTELAREAWRRGADWIIPIDADEFWTAVGGNLRDVLSRSSAGALQIEVLNFVQRREQIRPTPDCLLNMTHRTPLPVGPLEQVRELVEQRRCAFVEVAYSPKCIARATADLVIAPGNHRVDGHHGLVQPTADVVCYHAMIRARSVLDAKAEQGGRVAEVGLPSHQAWHVRRWAELATAEGLEAEWRANSHQDETIDVYGNRHRVVFDPRLRDLVAPHVAHPVEIDCAAERTALLATVHSQTQAHAQEVRGQTEVWRRKLSDQANLMADWRAEVDAVVQDRDRTIRALQAELLDKVDERDAIIRALQQELHMRVHERDATIRGLQEELHAKVGERDGVIRGLQDELHAKANEHDTNLAESQENRQRGIQAAGDVPAASDWLWRRVRRLIERMRRGKGSS